MRGVLRFITCTGFAVGGDNQRTTPISIGLILRTIRHFTYFTFCPQFSLRRRRERDPGRLDNGAVILPAGEYGCPTLDKFLFRYEEAS